jgi:pSer/pThr/pTyr-binding forkhead associated (FHA) protein
VPETTLSLAILVERAALAAVLGDLLDELPVGLGLLVVGRGPLAGTTFVVVDETTTLGRHPDSDIFLDDVTVSRRHATIERTPEGYVVSDGDSLNGTYVDHERIERTHLHDMHELQVGRFVLTFVLGGMEGER